MRMPNLHNLLDRSAIGHLQLAAATAPSFATTVPLRAAAPPTPATSASHVLLVDVAMPVHDRNVLVELVLLALHRSNISCAGAPAC